jgi:hypothetical protein
MFILDGKPLSPDRAFTTSDGTQYPANWLRLSSPEERAALGITEQPDAPTWDQRFYWGPDLPKDLDQLKEQWLGQVKQTAATLLQNTDWLVIRSQDLSSQKPIPDWALDERGLIRFKSDEKEAAILATTTVEEFVAYVTGSEFNVWRETPVEEPTSASDAVVIDGVTSGTFVTADALFGGSGEDTLTF